MESLGIVSWDTILCWALRIYLFGFWVFFVIATLARMKGSQPNSFPIMILLVIGWPIIIIIAICATVRYLLTCRKKHPKQGERP